MTYSREEKNRRLREWRKANLELARASYNRAREKSLPERKEYQRKYFGARVAEAYKYLQSHPCVDCGEADIEVLEFDHILLSREDEIQIDPRHRSPLQIIRRAGVAEGMRVITEECEVRCCNCHSRRTKEQLGHPSRLDYIQKYGK